MRHHLAPRLVITALIGAALAPAACSEPRVRNTRLVADDLIVMTDRMAQSIFAHPVVGLRTAESEPWVVTVDRVVNETSDILPEREKRAFLARLRALLNTDDELKQLNMRFVASAADAAALQAREGSTDADRLTPTHALAATFYSHTVADREIRSDAYLCAFQLVELGTDYLAWEDKYEVKRSVLRTPFD